MSLHYDSDAFYANELAENAMIEYKRSGRETSDLPTSTMVDGIVEILSHTDIYFKGQVTFEMPYRQKKTLTALKQLGLKKR